MSVKSDLKFYSLDWAAIQSAYDTGLTMRECSALFPVNGDSFSRAKREGLFVSRNYSQAQSKSTKHAKHTPEAKEKLSIAMTTRIKTNIRYSKQQMYNGVLMDSSWEVKLAKSLDAHDIKWIRPKALIWFDGPQKRRYLPDFYLPEFDVYLEPKNSFLQVKDKNKIEKASEHNNVKVILLLEHQCDWNVLQHMINL